MFAAKAPAVGPDDPLTRLENRIDEEESGRKKAVLQGLAWTARFVEDDERLDFIFSNYVLFLRELTLDKEDAATSIIASDLIEDAFARIKPRIGEVFPKSNHGKWDFISVLPFIFEFDLDRDFYFDFYISHFPEKHMSPYKKTFAKGVKTHNYDLLGDYLIDYSFLHYFNSDFPGHGFDLPGDTFDDFMKQVSALELIHDYASDEDDYFNQNYYVTHIVYVATDYGRTGMEDKDLEDRVADYLADNLDYVFYYEKDIDLPAEFVHCLALLGRGGDETVQAAVDYLVSQQLHDGSWGTQHDLDGDFYDQFHPTWAVASALHGFN
ncbi:MAG: hypothetical protein ABIJ56_13195 [Pseudomonadota bacterium]